MAERDEQLERGTAAPVRSAPESEAAAPVAFLPTALGNQAFGSLVATGVLPRADISMHLSMLEEIAPGRPLFGTGPP